MKTRENNQETKHKCLLLNSDYVPIRIISWKQAMIIDYRNKNKNHQLVDIVEYHSDSYVNGTQNQQHRIPSIIRIKKYINLYKRQINFSRRNLFVRDKHTCQYCGDVLSMGQLTYDHVIPKSRYKPNYKKCTTWTNVVTSCKKCNAKKADKTPKEANMTLLRNPFAPPYNVRYLPLYSEIITIKNESTYAGWMPFVKDIISNE